MEAWMGRLSTAHGLIVLSPYSTMGCAWAYLFFTWVGPGLAGHGMAHYQP